MLSTDFDADADALYIRLRVGTVARTEEIDPWTLVDVDQAGLPLGIEVIHPARQWPVGQVIDRYAISDEDRQMLNVLFPQPGQGLVSFPAPDLVAL